MLDIDVDLSLPIILHVKSLDLPFCLCRPCPTEYGNQAICLHNLTFTEKPLVLLLRMVSSRVTADEANGPFVLVSLTVVPSSLTAESLLLLVIFVVFFLQPT